MESADDFTARLANIDPAGTLHRAREAVSAAERARDEAQAGFDQCSSGMLVMHVAVTTGQYDVARLQLQRAETALEDAQQTLRNTEADILKRASAIIDPACRAAADRIAGAIEEIEAGFAFIEAVQRSTSLRRLNVPNLGKLCALSLSSVIMFGQRVADAVPPPPAAQ